MNEFLTLAHFLVFLSVVVNLIGGYSYIKETLKGNTKPNRVTWFLWGVIPMISVSAIFSEGFSLAMIPVFMAGFIPFLVVAASFFNENAEWKLSKLDYTCGIISALAIILWVATNNPLMAVIFAVIADALAALPTVKKAREYPETESRGPYFAGFFGGIVGMIVLNEWSPLEYLFPLYLFILNSIMLILISRKTKKQ